MSLKTLLLSGIGLLLLAMGAVGLLLPVWPTTPFVLAAAACFTRNPRLRAWVIRIPFLREYIQNHQDKKGLPRKTVIGSLVFLWGMLALSAWLVGTVWIAACLSLVGAAVTFHILWVARPRRGA